MNRGEMLEVFARYRGDSPVIVGPGICGRILYKISHHRRRSTTWSWIRRRDVPRPCHVAAGGAGVRARGRRLHAHGGRDVEHGGALSAAQSHIVVIDNRAYVTTGAMASATASGTDLAAMARGAGMDQVARAADMTALDASLQRATSTDGPHLIVVDVEADQMADLGKYPAMPFDIVEFAIRFRRNLEDRELVPPIWAI